MNSECNDIRDLIADSVTGSLPREQARHMDEHLEHCDDCRRYAQALQREDLLLARLVARIATNTPHRRKQLLGRLQSGRHTYLTKWRKIMRSSIAKLAVAAVVALACVWGFFLLNGTRGMALADVLAKVEQVEAFRYKMTGHVKAEMHGATLHEANMIVSMLISNGYGMRMDMSSTDPNDGEEITQQMYILAREKMIVELTPGTNEYKQTPLNEATFEEQRQQRYDPRWMLKTLLECKYIDLGKSVVGGTEVQGFQTTDPAYTDSYDDIDVRIWVSLRTSLPIRVEMKMNKQLETEMTVEMESTLYDFQWDVPVTAAEFTPVIPSDFTSDSADALEVPEISQVSGISEEAVITGLNRCIEFSGKYPDDLNPETLTRLVTEGLKRKMEQSLKSRKLGQQFDPAQSARDMAAESVDAIEAISPLDSFYMDLVQEQREPAYYGDIVTPGDIAQVLLRWKTGENQYRVIFADLHAETVSADTLAKLEAALPK